MRLTVVSYFGKLSVKVYLRLAEQLYGPFAWAYEAVAWLVSFGLWKKWREDTLGYLKAGKVLEVGSGTGALLVEMCRRGYNVVGLEPSRQMLRVTKRRVRREKTPVRIVRASAGYMPFPDEHFSCILATFPSNYIIRENSLIDIKRILRDDGCVVIAGFGVTFKHWLKRWLTGWFLENEREAFIAFFRNKAQGLGFTTEIIHHQGGSYSLPIVIMEKKCDR